MVTQQLQNTWAVSYYQEMWKSSHLFSRLSEKPFQSRRKNSQKTLSAVFPLFIVVINPSGGTKMASILFLFTNAIKFHFGWRQRVCCHAVYCCPSSRTSTVSSGQAAVRHSQSIFQSQHARGLCIKITKLTPEQLFGNVPFLRGQISRCCHGYGVKF